MAASQSLSPDNYKKRKDTVQPVSRTDDIICIRILYKNGVDGKIFEENLQILTICTMFLQICFKIFVF
jgi:hypothetical protein